MRWQSLREVGDKGSSKQAFVNHPDRARVYKISGGPVGHVRCRNYGRSIVAQVRR